MPLADRYADRRRRLPFPEAVGMPLPHILAKNRSGGVGGRFASMGVGLTGSGFRGKAESGLYGRAMKVSHLGFIGRFAKGGKRSRTIIVPYSR